MRKLIEVLLIMATTTSFASEGALLDQEFRRLAADDVVNLGTAYEGKVVLVVNTASKCGNTPQYEGLEKLYQEFGDDGLVVLGFPSNDFFGQEPGTYPTWNFHKYLIGRDGKLIGEFSPRTKPYDEKLVASIEAALET